MATTLLHWTYWISILLLIYTFAGYPLLVYLWARIKPERGLPVQADHLPMISVVVSALNEGENIGRRIDNILAQDYPPERFELIVASDGSSDETELHARKYESDQVRVVAFETRRGKPSVLNEVIPTARGEIILLADTRQRFHPDVMRNLASRFADEGVGAVSGELRFIEKEDSSSIGEGIGFYWHYEKFLRRKESEIDSTVGVTGAVYALRKDLFREIPPDTILDDVLIPMQVVRQGYRVCFDSSAIALDVVAENSSREFTRKVRTLAGNFQLFMNNRWLLNPMRNRLWLQTWSHKVMRLTAPPLMVLALIVNIPLAGSPFYAVLLAGQIIFYIAAITGFAQGDEARKPAFISIPYTFCMLNFATVVGFLRYIRGEQKVTWTTTTSTAQKDRSSVA